MSRQDDIAAKAVRKSTLKSLKEKKHSRLKQLKVDYEKQIVELVSIKKRKWFSTQNY